MTGGGTDFFGFVKRCLVYLWVRHLVHNRYIFGVADEKSFNRLAAENAIKPLVFTYHGAMSKFLGSKMSKFSIFLNFSKIYCA